MIPPITIPDDARCQEASMYSRNSYIPCGAPATAIVYHAKDHRGYYMCDSCTCHNVRNRGGRIVTLSPHSRYSYKSARELEEGA